MSIRDTTTPLIWGSGKGWRCLPARACLRSPWRKSPSISTVWSTVARMFGGAYVELQHSWSAETEINHQRHCNSRNKAEDKKEAARRRIMSTRRKYLCEIDAAGARENLIYELQECFFIGDRAIRYGRADSGAHRSNTWYRTIVV